MLNSELICGGVLFRLFEYKLCNYYKFTKNVEMYCNYYLYCL